MNFEFYGVSYLRLWSKKSRSSLTPHSWIGRWGRISTTWTPWNHYSYRSLYTLYTPSCFNFRRLIASSTQQSPPCTRLVQALELWWRHAIKMTVLNPIWKQWYQKKIEVGAVSIHDWGIIDCSSLHKPQNEIGPLGDRLVHTDIAEIQIINRIINRKRLIFI